MARRTGNDPERARRRALVSATWGVLGTLALMGEAVVRLSGVFWDAVDSGSMTSAAWIAVAGWAGANAYLEGWRGFHLRFAPRAVARALRLGRENRRGLVLLAPLVCAGMLHATRRRLLASWALVGTITGFILLVRGLPQPWRAVVDAGVVVGLVVGGASLVLMLVRGLRGELDHVPTDFPGDVSPSTRPGLVSAGEVAVG